MKDYSKGKIYTIRCLTDKNLIYVGSTIQSLAVRWGEHKRKSKIHIKRIIYTTINGNWSNWKIELHSLYPCNCIEELRAKEGEIIRLIGTLNMKIAGRTQQEWNEENKEKRADYQKIYREINKEEIAEYDKIRSKFRRKYNKEYAKIYAENKKEELKKYKKAYYERTKVLKNNIPIIVE